METNISSKNPKSNEKGKNILIIVLAVLVLLSGIKLYTDYLDKTKKSEEILLLSEENNDLNRRLDSVTYQLDLRIQEVEKLGGDVAALEEMRNQLLAERNSDKKRTSAEIAALNQKINSYTAAIREKDEEILKLREENQQLFSENQNLKSTQTQMEQEVTKLNTKQQELQEKVNVASTLRAENISIAAVNSRGREREDGFRNRQIDKLKVSFNIADNKVAEHGPRDIYLQVIAPNNQPIFDVGKGSGTFKIDGKEEFYTAHQDLLFNNTKQQVTYFYEKGTKYNPGVYEVRIFCEGLQIGSKTFEVK